MAVKIISARDLPTIGPQGQRKITANYEFTIDDLGPFIYSTPKEDDTAENLKAAIEQKRAIIASGE